jgi:ElaA protein
MELSTVVKPFDKLTTAELYAILWLRSEVFVVEQQCVFQDIDNKDQYCHHLMLLSGDELAAYARIVPPGISYPEMSIGRVITNPKYRRGTGIDEAGYRTMLSNNRPRSHSHRGAVIFKNVLWLLRF